MTDTPITEMVKPILTPDEYDTIMRALYAALVHEDGGPRHEEISWTYHSLGTTHGYPKGH